MITPKRHNTAEEYPIATLMQHLQHALTPTQLDRLHWLLFARIALGTLAQTRVCLDLAQLTSIAPNTWRQRLKRFRQQPFPEQTLFPALLRLVVEWLRLPQVFLALDATTLGNRWTELALGVVVHHHTIPIAWRVVRGNTKGAWLPLCEAMRALLRGALPKSIPVYVLTDRGLWSPKLFGAIVRNGWHPLMRVNAQGNFRPLWGRRAQADNAPAIWWRSIAERWFVECSAQRSTVRTVPTASVPPSRRDRARMVATSCAGGRVRGTDTAISTTAESSGATIGVVAGRASVRHRLPETKIAYCCG